jgi:hypothetical protein
LIQMDGETQTGNLLSIIIGDDMNEPTKAIQYLIDTAPLYAKAKADRMYLEEFRKSRKAQLMSQAGTEVLGKQEVYAYAHHDYVEILEGIREAVTLEEEYRFLMRAAEARIEVWRTNQYSARMELKATT